MKSPAQLKAIIEMQPELREGLILYHDELVEAYKKDGEEWQREMIALLELVLLSDTKPGVPFLVKRG